MPRSRTLAAAVSIAVLAACATVRRPVQPPPHAASAPAEDVPVARRLAVADGADPQAGPREPPAAAEPGGAAAPSRIPPPRDGDQDRLVARAVALLGARGPFRVGPERFRDDCSGFVEAVYAAHGLDLRGDVLRGVPREARGARAAWEAARALGKTFGADEMPEPGDLVFWHDTYDRNRNRKADDRFTHVGVVERVEDGTVLFVHRGAKGVARGAMTLARRHEARDAGGRLLNSTVQARSHPARRGGLAAELFAGFARLDGIPRRPTAQNLTLRATTPPRAPVRARAAR